MMLDFMWIGSVASAVLVAALLGRLMGDWEIRRRVRVRDARGARINTVWADHKVIYDHPIRGQGSREFYKAIRALTFPPMFLAPLVFPKR